MRERERERERDGKRERPQRGIQRLTGPERQKERSG